MKKLTILFSIVLVLIAMTSFGQTPEKYVSSKSHIKFFSTTPVEDIEANNYAAVSTINPNTGDVVFSVPMQSFEFEKALMQKHFNSDKFLDTSTSPKSKLKGIITNLDEIDFSKDGVYKANFEGTITIKDKTNELKESGTITIDGKTATLDADFDVLLADFGVTFTKGKPSKNIAKTVEVTVKSEYLTN